MLRAPIWKTSKYSSAISKSAGLTISLTTFKSYLSLVFLSIFNPSTPNPWKSYGDVRGLKAPPLINFSPLACKSAATASTCSCDSTEHGPKTNDLLPSPIIPPLSN
jgi:hypothetical protein